MKYAWFSDKISPVLGSLIPNSWQALLPMGELGATLEQLESFLRTEEGKAPIYPAMNHVFRALDLVSPQDVKVIIVGQDPYHGDHQANGLAFSVNDFCPYPPSLRNIFKELERSIGGMPSSGDLESWAKQGVLLLNDVLTVRKGEAGSHKNQGWESITAQIIRSLTEEFSNIVLLLWGKNAHLKEQIVAPDQGHLILKSVHPSPLSAYRGFFGCDHFVRTNQFLLEKHKQTIQWV